jgi:hypothetical protein
MKHLLALAFASAMACALAQTGSIYNGQPLVNSGGKIASWGGGKIEESKDTSLVGGQSLRIESANMFQGGLITLGAPVDLTSASQNKSTMLTLGLYVMATSGASGGSSGGGMSPQGGGRGKMGTAGGGGGGGQRYGGQGGGDSTSVTNVAMSKIRVVLKTSDGKLSEAILPVSTSGKWVRTSIPIASIPGFAKTNKMVTAIAVGSDAPAFFYVGEISAAQDSTPIQGYLTTTDLNIGKGTEVVLSGSAEAGATPLEYVWDFNAADGMQDESMGASIRHKFRTPGTFKVTLTIRDIYGIKQPWTGTINVTVNP